MSVGGAGKGGPGVAHGTSFTATGSAVPELWFRRRKVKPLIATPFVSAIAGRDVTCPACKTPLAALGDRYGCESCGGLFVETKALAQMIEEMTAQPWLPTAPSEAMSARVCPACAIAMTSEAIDDVALDRCTAHGYWFDAGELEATLQTAAAPDESLGKRALRWLFDR